MLYPAPENGIIRKGRKGEKRRGAGEKKRDDKQKRMDERTTEAKRKEV